MDLDRQIAETTALIQRANLYLNDLQIAKGWKPTAMMGGMHPEAEGRYAVALDRTGISYAHLLKAALDLFEDGDLHDKWGQAKLDAGMRED